MDEKTYTGSSLEQALKSGSLEKAAIELVGMVKVSEKAKHISFAKGDCETWIDLPTDLIDQAEHLGQRPCRDHVHPVFKVTLKEPKDPAAQILGSLLATPVSTSSQSGAFPIQGGQGFVTQPFIGAPAFQSSAQPAQALQRLGPTASAYASPTLPGGRQRAVRSQFYPPWAGAYPPWAGGDLLDGGAWDCWAAGCGGDTLPSCGYEQVVCGSSLPGYPPILCTIYCCRWPNGSNNCSII
jgi:hypothetical protein